VLIPFLETLCTGFDVVDTSMLTKEWDERGIERHKFAGLYTPDLLIASNWKLHKTEKVDYKSLIEIKTPTAQDRKHAESEVKEYLDKVSFVVLTDCVTWEFYMKENEQIYYSCYSLEQEHKTTHIKKNKIIPLKCANGKAQRQLYGVISIGRRLKRLLLAEVLIKRRLLIGNKYKIPVCGGE